MADAKQALKENQWLSSKTLFKVATLNVRSLIHKLEDLKSDSCLLQSDIIVITETHFFRNFKIEGLKIEGFEDYHVQQGKGKGRSWTF